MLPNLLYFYKLQEVQPPVWSEISMVGATKILGPLFLAENPSC